MEAQDAELADWLPAKAASRLAELPGRAAFCARVEELTEATTADSAFSLAGDRVFFQRQAAGAPVPVLMAAEGQATRVLLDPAALDLTAPAGREHSHLDWFVPSPDGRYVACGISQGGSESSTLRVLDADSGQLLPDAIPGTTLGAVSWLRLPEGDALLYHRYLDPPPGAPADERRRDSRACLHRLGAKTGDDLVVLARGVNPLVPLTPVDRPLVFAPGGSDWLLALISHSALSRSFDEELSACTPYVAPRAALADPAMCPWRRVAGPDDGVTAYAVHGDDLYLVSHRDAPRSRVLAVSMAAPELGARVVLPGSERAVAAVKVVGDHLLVHERDGGLTRLRTVPLSGGEPRDVTLPTAGFLGEWTAHPARPEVFFTLSSWIHAPRLYRYDGATVTDTGWLPPSTADFTGIVASDLRVPARDGTLIPLRVVHRAGLALDGTSPAILSGYGSYAVLPYWGFAPEMLAWYERGGSYAEAGLRGGGEYGREWHEAVSGPRKENTITDFIDCAEYLVGHGYTGPGRLAGEGGSAGAVPAGGALIRRPGLFGRHGLAGARGEQDASGIQRERPGPHPGVRHRHHRGGAARPAHQRLLPARRGRHAVPGRAADCRPQRRPGSDLAARQDDREAAGRHRLWPAGPAARRSARWARVRLHPRPACRADRRHVRVPDARAGWLVKPGAATPAVPAMTRVRIPPWR